MKCNLISMDKISGGNRKFFFFSRKEMPGTNKTKLYITSQREQICPKIPGCPGSPLVLLPQSRGEEGLAYFALNLRGSIPSFWILY
jgi:hypothetical protein